MTVLTSYGFSSEYLGGKHRCQTAKRDRWGRLLPNDGIELKPPTNHGVKGGKARAKIAKRGKDGRFLST